MGDRRDWTASGVFEVAAGVYRIPLPLPTDGLRAVNVYALEGPDGLALIDSGWAIGEARALLCQALQSLGYALADIEQFLVTHVHRDHFTQAVEIRRELGTRIGLGADERPSLDVLLRPDHPPMGAHLRVLRAHGAGALADRLEDIHRRAAPPAPRYWEPPDRWLEDGEVVRVGPRSLEIVHTPGHTRGHVVFHDVASGLLFGGDHVLPTITPSIGFEASPAPDPLGRFLASLARVRGRPDARLLPAHGPVTDSAHERVDQLLAHHEQRLGAIEALVRAGAATAAAAAERLPWTRSGRRLDELDPFNQMLAVSETAAHLEFLVAQGRLRVEDCPEAFCYCPG